LRREEYGLRLGNEELKGIFVQPGAGDKAVRKLRKDCEKGRNCCKSTQGELEKNNDEK